MNGGIWKTTNAGQTSPDWQPLTDFQSSLSVSSIAISPVDINADGTLEAGAFEGKTVYAGTGNESSAGISSGGAVGVLRSTDGTNFELMAGSEVFAVKGLRIRSIVPLNKFDITTQQQVVLIAAEDSFGLDGGVYVSSEAGKNFVKVADLPLSGMPDSAATHLVADLSPAGMASNRVYAAVIATDVRKPSGTAGVYMSEGGATWTKVDTGIPQKTLDHAQRIELAVSAVDGTVYAAVIGDNTAITMPLITGATVLNVEAPELFRSGDTVQLISPRTTITGSLKDSDTITLHEDIGLLVGDEVGFIGHTGIFTVEEHQAGLTYRLDQPLPFDVPADTVLVTQFQNNDVLYVIPGGVNVANKQITVDRLPGTTGLQGVQRAWTSGQTVRVTSLSRARTEMLYQSTNQGAAWANVPLPQPTGEFNNVTIPFGTGKLAAPWTAAQGLVIDTSSSTFQAAETGLNPGDAADLHFSMLATRIVDKDVLILAGDRQPNQNAAGAGSFSGRVFMGVVPSGQPAMVTWDPLVGNRAQADRVPPVGPDTPTGPHADSRDLVFLANSTTILEADDGGIVKFSPADDFQNKLQTGSTLGEWGSLAGTLGIAEFYGIAYDSFQDKLFGGTQDNGSPLEVASSSTTFRDVFYGDGAIPGVLSGATNVTRYFTSQNFRIGREVVTAVGDVQGTIVSSSDDTGHVRLTFSAPHNLKVNDLISVIGHTVAAYNQIHIVTQIVSPTVVQTDVAAAGDGTGGSWRRDPQQLTISAGGTALESFDFIQQWALNATDATRILVEHPTPVGGNKQQGSLYELRLNGAGTQLIQANFISRQTLKTTGMDLTAAKYGFAPADNPNGPNRRPNLIYAGFSSSDPTLSGKLFFREQGNGAPVELAGYRTQGGAGVRDIAIDPFDFHKIVVIDGNGQVWRSEELLPGQAFKDVTFKNITGTLLELTKGDIRSVEIVNATTNPGDETLLVGGLGGVYQLHEIELQLFEPHSRSPFQWSKLGLGMPNVLVTDVLYSQADDILFAGTWGRGIWSIRNFKTEDAAFPAANESGLGSGSGAAVGGAAAVTVTPPTVRGRKLVITGTAGNDEIFLRPSPGNPLVLEVLADGVQIATPKPLEFAGISTIVVDGLGSDDHLILDPAMFYVDGLTLYFHGGGGSDQMSVLGDLWQDGGPPPGTYDLTTHKGVIFSGPTDSVFWIDDVEEVVDTPDVYPRGWAGKCSSDS